MPYLSSLRKALNVLETFTCTCPELGSTEISTLLNINKSSISRILVTLSDVGYLEKNPSTNKYRLGRKSADLGRCALSRYDLSDIGELAISFLEELAAQLNEVVHLSVLDGKESVTILKKGNGQSVTVATKVGGRTPAHASALGKALLAGFSRRELIDLLGCGPLAQCTPNTITKIEDLIKVIEQVKRRGFAVCNEESLLGIQCIAAPITNDLGKVIAAISVSVPKQRMNTKRITQISKLVVDTARRISEQSAVGGVNTE